MNGGSRPSFASSKLKLLYKLGSTKIVVHRSIVGAESTRAYMTFAVNDTTN